MPFDFNQQIIEEFRANQGQVGGPFDGARLLLLTSTGAKSGRPHTTPLGYLPDAEGRMLVIASAAGAPAHPDWYHNLVANPSVTVEDGTFTYTAEATVVEGAERDDLFARAVEADPGWGEYQKKATRTIPVVRLEPQGGAPNATSWGQALKQIHDAFRRELTTIRKEVNAAGPSLGAQLRINCLAVCEGLHFHHTSEDGGLFEGVGAQYPELAPTLERLRAEHESIKHLIDELQDAVSADGADPAATQARVERLTTELEAHLSYEEEQLIPVLDTMG